MTVALDRHHKSPYVEPPVSIELIPSEINMALKLALIVDAKLEAKGLPEPSYEHAKSLPGGEITKYRVARFFNGNLSEIAFKRATGYKVRLDASGNDDEGYDTEPPAGRVNIKTRYLGWRNDTTTPMLLIRSSDLRPKTDWFCHSMTYHNKELTYAVVDFYGGISKMDARATMVPFDPNNGRSKCWVVEAHKLIPWGAYLSRLAEPRTPTYGEVFEFIQ